jgi:hypothetical protein
MTYKNTVKEWLGEEEYETGDGYDDGYDWCHVDG